MVFFNEWLYLMMLAHPETFRFGLLFLLVFLLAQTPYVASDIRNGRYGRVCLSVIGLRNLQEYEGFAGSPEMSLFTDTFARIPILLMVGILAAEGLDEAIMGEQENALGIILMFVLLVITAGGASTSTYKCVDAGRSKSQHVHDSPLDRVVIQVGQAIDSNIIRFGSYVTHAMDAIALTTVLSGVGRKASYTMLTMWFLLVWMICGMMPACIAPPPMPTLRPAIPETGSLYFLHRTVVSVVMVAFPPTQYMPVLDRRSQVIWSISALIRTALLVATSFYWPPPPIPVSSVWCAMKGLVLYFMGLLLTGERPEPCPVEDSYRFQFMVYIGTATTVLMALYYLRRAQRRESTSGRKRAVSRRSVPLLQS